MSTSRPTGAERGTAALHRVVASTLGAAVAAVLVAWHVAGGREGAAYAGSWWPVVALLALACLGEIAYVRLRHGESTEDLTLYEAVVVVDVCLLPPLVALAVPVLALALASTLLRRPLVKTLFNLGSYTVSTTVLVTTYAVGGAASAPFSLRWLAALVAGTLGFAAVNLFALSRVLAVVSGVPASRVVAEGWRLSAFMATGSVGLGTVAVAVVRSAPILLPFVGLPALALTYAYRAAARESDEQERSRCLLELGAAIARRLPDDELVPLVRSILQRMFRVTEVRIVVPGAVAADDLLHIPSGAEPVDIPADELPGGWRGGVAARIDGPHGDAGYVAIGRSVGPAARGSRPWQSDRRLDRGDRAMLTSVASTLSAALRAGSHLADLHDESSKLKAVVEYASDGIVVLDGRGDVLVWSPALAAMTGLAEADVAALEPTGALGIAHSLGLHLGPGESADPLTLLTPERPRAEVVVVGTRPDGEQREARVAASATFEPDGSLHRVVAIVHDITLERRLDRLKADFVATVSHELRTPITPIKGYARLLAARGHQLPPDRRQRALALIEERADHLARLVEDLLLSSRVSAEGSAALHIDSRETDLRLLVARAASGIPALAGRLTVEQPPRPVMVMCDAVRVVQCLTNLLSNAEKYSDAGTPVRIALLPPEPGTDCAAVAVTDAGHGIPQDELERVFERFHRVEDSLTMTTGGNGLGLYIARELARAMGGDLTVASRFRQGSTFTLRLPLAGSALRSDTAEEVA